MAGNKKSRGVRVTPSFTTGYDADKKLTVRAFNTKRLGQRLGKNTRLSDFERTNSKKTHTSPVTPDPSEK